MTGVQTRKVGQEDADIRVDRWFRRHFPELKHGRLEKLLRTGQIRIDGGRAKASTRLEPGQVVRVPPLHDQGSEGRASAGQELTEDDRKWIRSLVIHSDEHVIALNKPPGIAVQGGSRVGRHIDGLLSGLVPSGAEKPKLVHRLDRDTSGVLLIARRADIAAAIGKTFRGRNAEKNYWALVVGVPSPREGRIDAALMKAAGPGGYEKVVVDTAMGKSAITDYRVIDAAGRKAAWLLLQPRTGRTHQLRVHCAGIGTPIMGDRKYGGHESVIDGPPAADRLHLHARSISLPHPAGGTLQVEAPLPPTMIQSWEFFGFDPEHGVARDDT